MRSSDRTRFAKRAGFLKISSHDKEFNSEFRGEFARRKTGWQTHRKMGTQSRAPNLLRSAAKDDTKQNGWQVAE
jgi:hypothetical protein